MLDNIFLAPRKLLTFGKGKPDFLCALLIVIFISLIPFYLITNRIFMPRLVGPKYIFS